MYRDKRGVSQIITTIILVLISLVAALAVWQIVERYVNPGGGGPSIDCFSIQLNVGTVTCAASGNDFQLRVPITRGSDNLGNGQAKVTALKADGTSAESNEADLNVMGTVASIVNISADKVTETIITPGLTLTEKDGTLCAGTPKTITGIACTGCVDAGDCTAGQGCVSNACGVCTTNAHCQDNTGGADTCTVATGVCTHA